MKPPLPPNKKDKSATIDMEINANFIENNTKNLAVPNDNQKKPKKNSKNKLNDMRYSRGLSWSHDNEGFYKNVNNQKPIITSNKMLISERVDQPKVEVEMVENENISKKKSCFDKLKHFFRGKALEKESELVIKIENLNTRENYDLFIEKLRSIDKKFIKKVRFVGLKDKFPIQQWKDIEFRIRDWPLTELKFECTRLEVEHCKTLLYMLMNKAPMIEKLKFNYNGLTSETASLLFLEKVKLKDLINLKKLSIKNNPCIFHDDQFYQKISNELSLKNKNCLGFVYKIGAEIKSKKINFCEIDFSENELDDKKLKKIVLGLEENHSYNDINSLNFSSNEKITENGWLLFAEKYLKNTLGLQILNLSNCNLNENSLIRICEGLSGNKALTIQTIDLSNNANISYKGLLFFARKVLLKSRSLEKLLMVRCGLTDHLIEGLVDGMLLDPSNIEIVSKQFNLSVSSSFSPLQKTSLVHIDLSQNWNVSPEGWKKILFPILSMAPRLTTLLIQDCVLNEKKIKEIVNLTEGLHLKVLDVSSNESITELLGWPLYANAFVSKSSRLESLRLTQCNLTAEKLSTLGVALGKNFTAFETLREVNLSCNLGVGEIGLVSFLKDLATKFKGLKILTLRKIGISDQTIFSLSQELEKQDKTWFSQLSQMDLSENPLISLQGFQILAKNILSYVLKTLECLFLEDMALDDSKLMFLIDFFLNQISKSQPFNLNSFSISSNKSLAASSFSSLSTFLISLPPKTPPFTLSLRNCFLTNQKLSYFFETLQKDHNKTALTLHCLDLSQNTEISNEGLQKMAVLLNEGKLLVREIRMKDCRLDVKKLKDFQLNTQFLTTLDLSENPNISDINSIVENCPNLSDLSLKQCNLEDSDLKDVAIVVRTQKLNCKFRKINFAANKDLSASVYKAFLVAFFATGTQELDMSVWGRIYRRLIWRKIIWITKMISTIPLPQVSMTRS